MDNTLNPEIKKLGYKYSLKIKKIFGALDPIIILYGSSIRGVANSDFDVCTIMHFYDEQVVKTIKDLTIEFHKSNGLQVDNEVPFDNKIIYSFSDIEKMLSEPPFPKYNGKFILKPMEKNPEYLSTHEVKLRLLLNVLTTYSVVLTGNELIIQHYKDAAWELIIELMYSYMDYKPLSIEQFVESLCKNPFGVQAGENFLGYDKNDIKLSDHLSKMSELNFEKLIKTGQMSKSGNQYILQKQDKWQIQPDKLNFAENTNPFGPPLKIRESLKSSAKYINQYPDYLNTKENTSLAKFFDVPYTNIAIANGSLEAIYALPYFLDSSSPSIITPTYWGYEEALKNLNLKYNKFNIATSFEFDESCIDEIASKSSILFICNPNNPTSSFIDNQKLYNIIRNNPQCHFVVDESHLMLDKNFANESLCRHISRVDNLSLVYSLSKFFGIAGLRVGTLISSNTIINQYKKWQIPYSVHTIGQILLPICLDDQDFIEMTREKIHELVNELYEELCKFSWLDVRISKTSFVLCRIKEGLTAIELSKVLEKKGIYIRELTTSYPDLEGEWIRISVNTRENNYKLIEELSHINRLKEEHD